MINSHKYHIKPKNWQKLSQARLRLAIAIPLLVSATTVLPRPVLAAQRIYISYAPIERSISVDALANYAQKR